MATTVPDINVQFSDAEETTIISYFGAPKNSEWYANLGVASSADARWLAYYNGLSEKDRVSLPVPDSLQTLSA